MRHFSLIAVVSFFTFLLTAQISNAAKVDTVVTHSKVMNKDIKAVVITPTNYSVTNKYPVVYLLHGFSDNYSAWLTKPTEPNEVAKLSDRFNVIIVCPDGATSWYMDSPVDPAIKYETYIASELIPYVDAHFATIKDRTGRAITGLSMGGHGALFLAFRHQDIFGAVGSMSGGVDLRPFPGNWNLAADLGKYSEHHQNWDDNSIVNMTHLLSPNSLAIIFDCGSDDFFYKVNNNLHNELLERNIPHDFKIRPGGHSWSYWSNSINYQMLFFSRYFTSKN